MKTRKSVCYPAAGSPVGIPVSQPLPTPSRRLRRGVTLLELLVVLAILGVSTVVALPVLRAPAADAEPSSQDALVRSARRLAVSRGEPVRLRLATDGVWAIVGARDGTTLRVGRIDAASPTTGVPTDTRLDLRIDAMGSCVPVRIAARAFDPARCAVVDPVVQPLGPERSR